jgi:RHS repeat-associated protein
MTMTDSTGTPIANQRMAYNEYGDLSCSSTTVGEQFLYTGRRCDPETGLYYYRARYYSPQLGRFLQTDPVGYGDDLNVYTYVGDDPLDHNDPTGDYGCGQGFTKASCDEFNRAQAYAADKLAKAAARLRAALAAGGKAFDKAAKAFEKEFGKGTGSAENMTAMAGKMTSMASALKDDGSSGHWATLLSGNAFKELGDSTAMARAGAGQTMLVNLDHPFFGQANVLGWAAGHESGHDEGLTHPRIGGIIPYAMGDTRRRALFNRLSSIDPAAALTNPDKVMMFSFGKAPL